jgi:signal peptidase II
VLIRSRRAGAFRYPRLVELSLALILGGALGNLFDRVRFGYVTDFFDFDFPDFIMTRWPVFNIADSAVTTGVTLWCVYLVFFAKKHVNSHNVILP